jgi:hypothetical protein
MAKLPLSRVFATDARLGRSLALPKTVDCGVSNSRTPSIILEFKDLATR